MKFVGLVTNVFSSFPIPLLASSCAFPLFSLFVSTHTRNTSPTNHITYAYIHNSKTMMTSQATSNKRMVRKVLQIAFVWMFFSLHLVAARSKDYVTTDFQCYEQGESIHVRFDTSMATMQNWIGIYNQMNVVGKYDSDDSVQSQWACGSHDEQCHGQTAKERNTLIFDPITKPGLYNVVLKATGYHGKASTIVSKTFIIKADGQPCGEEGDFAFTDKKSYKRGEHISVSFGRIIPDEQDVVAIYPDPSSTADAKPPLWVWTCGSQECRDGSLDHGDVQFGTYFLPTGSYVAVLGQLLPDGVFVRDETTPRFFVDAEHPEDCPTVVRPFKSCFDHGREVQIDFGGCTLRPSDKVAIFQKDEDASTSRNPISWMYGCGDRRCHEEEELGDGDFDEDGRYWPLNRGEYRVVLVRQNPGAGESMRFIGESFQVAGDGMKCEEKSSPMLRSSRKQSS